MSAGPGAASVPPAGEAAILGGAAHALAEPTLILRAHVDRDDGPPARAVVRLEGILDGLVRLTSASRAAEIEVVALGPLLQRAARGLVLGGTAGDAAVEADRGLLGLLLEELVGNARVHAGGAAVRVDAHAGPGGAWTLVVTDDGPGLPDGPPPRPFGRDPAGGARARVGLEVARRVAAAHGGRLDVGPAEAGGVRAAVVVPART